MTFDLRMALTSIAPTLAAMLGGPLAGTAVTALESAFGLAAGVGKDGITQVIQTGAMTTEMIAAVRAADQRHAEMLGQQGIDLAKLNADHDAAIAATDAGDRGSARTMQVANHSAVPAVLSVLVTVGFFGVLLGMMVGELKVSESQALLLMLGALGAAWGSVVAYWFGSTHDSFSKTQMLAQSSPVATTPPER